MTFSDLQLHSKILEALETNGYSEPTGIQSKAIPKILKGFDLRASAQTGTGKTAAFLLPALHRLTESAPKGPQSKKAVKGPRVLILAPTRELAMQITAQAHKYGRFLRKARTVCITGGVSYHLQMRQMNRPYDILIATPGRLIDHIERGKVDLSRVELLVLDEADRMLDMGFIEPVEQIAAATPADRQTLLFSATLEGSIKDLSERLMNDPMEIRVHTTQDKHENITQGLHFADNLGHKHRMLEQILGREELEHAIVFTSTKRHADELVTELKEKGYRAAALHGDMNQRQRSRTVSLLREGKLRVLIATDVAARGIDVQSISHVINFSLPHNAEDYVHRIGRTGRAGAKGTALSFADGRDAHLVKKIQQYTGQTIDVLEIPGLEPQRKPQPSRQRQGQGRKGNGPRGKGQFGRKSFGRGGRPGSNRKPGGFKSGGFKKSGRTGKAKAETRS